MALTLTSLLKTVVENEASGLHIRGNSYSYVRINTAIKAIEDSFLSNEQVKLFKGNFEIVSLIGTLSQDGNHTHISVSDNLGHTIGGHLKKGCIIHTTAEIVIIELKKFNFSREFDHQTGFKELVINNLK